MTSDFSARGTKQSENRQRGSIPGVRGPIAWNGDGFATRHVAPFLNDQRFAVAHELGRALQDIEGAHPAGEWRAHVACWVLGNSLRTAGDCMVIGFGSAPHLRTAITYLELDRVSDRTFWLVQDASESRDLDEDSATRSATTRHFSSDLMRMRDAFMDQHNVQVASAHPIDTLNRIGTESLSCVVLDLERERTEEATLAALWERLAPGATVLLEHYGTRGPRSERCPFERFVAEQRLMLLSLPTGQAILHRP